MICKKLKKQITSLLLTSVMTLSAFDMMSIHTFAKEDVTEDVTSTGVEVNEESFEEDTTDLGTGYLGMYKNGADNSVIRPISEYEELVENESGEDIVFAPKADSKYPSHVDNSQSKYFPPVGSQERIGSCVCWSGIYYAFTYELCKVRDVAATGKNIMSPAFIYGQAKSWMKDYGGTWSDAVIDFLMQEGTPSFESADFESYDVERDVKSWNPKKEIWQEAEKNRLTGAYLFEIDGQITNPKDDDLDEIKKYLNEGHVLTFGAQMSGMDYKNIPDNSPYAGESIIIASLNKGGGHQMAVVGYDDDIFYDINQNGIIEEGEKGAFKFVNSWSSAWQNDGFCWVSYDALNIESSVGYNPVEYYYDDNGNLASYTRVKAMDGYILEYIDPDKQMSSGVDMVLKLNTAKRNQDIVEIIAKDKDGNEYSAKVTATYRANHLDYALDGSEYATDGVITFDLNNVIENISADNVNDYEWFVKISDSYEDHNPFILKEAYIECNGVRSVSYNDKISVDNSNKTVKLENKINLEIEWNIDGTIAPVGEKRTFTVNYTKNGASVPNAKYKFVITGKGAPKVIKDFDTNNSCKWLAEYEGDYSILCYVHDGGEHYTVGMDFSIREHANKAVIYYNNDSWEKANIHYCINNGKWTKVPGEEMQPSDNSDYRWKYVIELGTEDGAQVCFNNGKNVWDSKNAKNYKVKSGKYAIENNTIYVLEDPKLSADIEFMGEVGSKEVKVTVNNGVGPYTVDYKIYKDNKLQENKTKVIDYSNYGYISFSMYYEGRYRFEADIKDANGNECYVAGDYYFPGLIIDLETDKDNYLVGENVTVTAKLTNLFYYYSYPKTTWSVEKDGVSVDYGYAEGGIEFTPTQAGTYKVTYSLPDYSLGAKSNSITINVADNNKAVIYYKNSSWSKANIHYCVDNGSWTKVPGVAMQASDKDGYTWMYTIDLGNESGASVCFNNGNNWWDSRNGSNYRVSAGQYTIVNGTVTKL